MPTPKASQTCLLFLGFLFSATPLVAQKSGKSVSLSYANNFSITQYPGYKKVSVRNVHRSSTNSHEYLLVPKNQPLPENSAGTRIIRTPVARVIAMETVYIGHMEALGQLDTLIGAATVDYISNPTVREHVASGKIATVQFGQNLDIERVLILRPELIFTSISGDPAFDIPAQMVRSGLPVVLSAGYMEPHPLARAEWIRFYAAFFEKDAEAEALFAEIATRYEELASKVSTVEERPTVFCSAPYSGSWHMPGGQSYTAQAIFDAGGDYLWKDNSSGGNLPLDTERVFLKAADADFWINPSYYRSREALLATDPRFTKFKAARTGQIYNNTRQVTESGGNPIWESGVVHPDIILADLVRIFHPALLPEHELVYHEQLD